MFWMPHPSLLQTQMSLVPQLMFPSTLCSFQCSSQEEMLTRSWHAEAEAAYLWSNRAVLSRLIFEVIILGRIFGIIQPSPCYCLEVVVGFLKRYMPAKLNTAKSSLTEAKLTQHRKLLKLILRSCQEPLEKHRGVEQGCSVPARQSGEVPAASSAGSS